MLVSPSCGAAGTGTGGVDLALEDERLLREFEFGRSESS
jgi:hypothetical protein